MLQTNLMKMSSPIIHTKVDTKKIQYLLDKILHEEIVDLTSRSTRGINSKQFTFKNLNKLEEIVKIIQEKLTQLDSSKTYNLLSAWTVIGDENAYHKAHKHNENVNHIATITYLNVPPANFHQSGDFYYFYNDNNIIQKGTISPVKGSLIIMPINLFHGTYPQAKGKRQTLNLDFEINDK